MKNTQKEKQNYESRINVDRLNSLYSKSSKSKSSRRQEIFDEESGNSLEIFSKKTDNKINT